MLKIAAPAIDEDQHAALSELLSQLCDGEGPLTIGEMIDHFGERAFGALLFAFSVPNLLPLPPGSSTVLGAPLLILAPQLMLGVPTPWLPKSLKRRSVDRAVLAKAFSKLIPRLRQMEKVTQPRLDIMFGSVGDRLIGLAITLLALVLILPIPLGNMLPAASVAALSFGLVQRDGAVV
ncbi:MAG: exopolysaccharide biosynthesis protein, partial [Caulobacteraceae bacterium]